MKYSEEKLNEIADKVDIVELIGQTELLHRKGGNYFVCCPFHNGDDTPSLCINPKMNKWHCFGCGAGSSVYDWICLKYNKTFPEAFEYICNLVGENPEQFIESESIQLLKQLKKKKNTKQNNLVNVRKFLDFTDDYINKYDDELPQEWLEEDMTPEALKTYNIRIDHNANRIVYPVYDASGNFIGVKGRTRISAYKELGLPKYMNYYKVGEVDYFQGLQQALPEIRNKKSVIIFEGIKSCIKAWGWGIKNTISSETSKLSEGQVKLLIKLGIPEIVIAWDSDKKISSIVGDPKIQTLKHFSQISIITDTKKILDDKMAPVDKGEEIFRILLNERRKI